MNKGGGIIKRQQLLVMLVICTMAMSTIGSSFATVANQQTAENIVNSALVDENIVKDQSLVNTVESSSTETQNSVQNTQNKDEITNSAQISKDTVQNTNCDSEPQLEQSTQTNNQDTTPAVDTSSQNSKDSSLTNQVSNENTQNTIITQPQAAAGDNYTNIRGIWLRAEDSSSITVTELKNANITDIFVKTNLISDPTYKSVLGNLINKFQNSGIRIHAWITCFKDANGNWINPANATQRSFLLNTISDILTNYNINGIHLDYVRYSGAGSNAAYNNANAVMTITSFVSDVKQLIQSKKPKVALSAAVMPEGSSNAYIYGQDYGQLAKYVDFLVPMIYKGSYGKDTSWIGTTTKYIVEHAIDANGNKVPVIAGLQTYVSDYDTTLLTADDLYQDINSAIDNGASGYVLFRYGMISQGFLKPPSFTLTQIEDAASRVKAYIEANKKLPNFVTVATSQVKISDFLKLMITSVLQLNKGITTSVKLQNVIAPQDSTGSFTSGSFTKSAYIDAANRVNSFIESNDKAPNYATTTLGKIPYESLVYMYSKILNFSKTNNYLPSYVTMDSAMKISAPVQSDLSIKTVTMSQVKDAASRVKSYIETNKALPKYVTIGTEQVKMTDFLRLLVMGTIQINDGSWAQISLKSVKASTEPRESIKAGNITEANYIDIAKRVKAFIDANGVIPNVTTTPLGEMRPESLIYMFSKILNFQKTNNALPLYVSMKSWSEVTKLAAMSVPASLQQYLAATANCQVNNAQIKSLAASITSGKATAYDKAVAIFNWVRDNIGYSFYYNTRYGAVGTLNAGTGNCVDTAHLVVALERAAGIPAEYVHGYCQFSSGSWYGHVWAKVWVNGVWYRADATSSRNTFGVINNWNRATATVYGTYASLPF